MLELLLLVAMAYTVMAIIERATTAPKVDPSSYSGSAYCIVCKANVSFTGGIRTSDSGRRIAYGKCPSCATKVNRILGKP